MVRDPLRARLALAAAYAAFSAVSTPAFSQSPPQPRETELPSVDITVTANRSPTEIQRTGSAITVVPREQLQASNPGSLVDVLRTVPGLDVTETGGPGASTTVRLRGASSGQTLVLIDGVRVGDPSSASSEFDLSILSPALIDRIEVLRGPQSALYGSDAMGGVINIITKRGLGPTGAFAQIEGGSYGTGAVSGGIHGSQGPWSYAASGSFARSDGFSRYGYRISRFDPAVTAGYDADGYDRYSGYGRFGYDPGTGFRFEAGVMASATRSEYDAASGKYPDTPNVAFRRFYQIYGRGSWDTLDGALTHAITTFFARSERIFREVRYGSNQTPAQTTSTLSEYYGQRVGAEYQGDLRLGLAGRVTFGARLERETAETFSERYLPTPIARASTLEAGQNTRALFALWQLPLGERLDLSIGGRIDDVVGVARFATWRGTLAYRITETGTKLRASAGTGGKAPTLFQLYAPIYGNPNLQAETSLGFDAGIDQSILGGRGTLSVTAFTNRFSNLIEYNALTSSYFNVARAETRGVEMAASFVLWPDVVRMRAGWTYLEAKDLTTGLTLARRPRNVGTLGFVVTPTPAWSIEPSMTYVSQRYSGSGETLRLNPYMRFDLRTSYQIDKTWTAFARVENLTNVRYEEVYNYGTAGRSFYAGLRANW
ncbi:vitamin B12 transporter [Phreatobacter oligotrophus]|uniref:Vitamin B12 transporter n=1 Tax=Phreatobacter oligotrophus TaxID=1122261 RepID=A0A2T4ZEA5_9HYPH|nr:vitamin B12 transporter [Phreatobacter oligotrophus]